MDFSPFITSAFCSCLKFFVFLRLPRFFSSIFFKKIVSVFTLITMIHFELIFVYGCKIGGECFFIFLLSSYVDSLSRTVGWKKLFCWIYLVPFLNHISVWIYLQPLFCCMNLSVHLVASFQDCSCFIASRISPPILFLFFHKFSITVSVHSHRHLHKVLLTFWLGWCWTYKPVCEELTS